MNQEHSPATEDNLLARAKETAAQLGETTPEALDQILRLYKLQGETVVDACLAEALAIQASGGERLPNGGRLRTLGGIFFRLTRARRDEAAGRSVDAAAPAPNPPQRRRSMPWEARRELLSLLPETKGTTMSVKVMLSGRPGKVERREGTVVLMLDGGQAPPLPRGVPAPPAQPAPFICYLDSQQWAEVEPALADPADMLMLEGYCAADPETGSVAVFVQLATTRSLQRTRAAASKNKPRRPGGGQPPPRRTFTPPSRTYTPVAEPPHSLTPPVVTPPITPPSPPPAPAAEASGLRFLKGMRVRHPQMGEGEVIRSEPRDGDEAVTVDFASVGLRRVLARVSGLQIT